MSTTIDRKVVEMRFDNRHFEQNVKGTMSTLDKLKQKLNLSGASKGLDNISTSAKKVDMSGLAAGVQAVQARFSALDVIGVTALANITNSAVNAGKQIVHSLTVAPVTDGWKEYEMLLNSIQTTMAGTGLTAKQVEEQLKKLDDYADKTVYSTADMLNNLPKFTNAGVDLEVATKAMIGIANATAHAGGDASKASIAFYNLGQAIGTGYLTRMDYNSINNAGIATMQWKESMVEAAIAAGTLKKVGEDSYKAGNKTLTMQQLFIDGLQEQWATTEVMLKVFGDYGDETTEIGKKAFSAAQDIKTFTMMMDSLKATAGTGWKDTWEIIFGDLDEAKEFWTGLTNFISNIIENIADFRNKILEGALGRSFTGLFDNIRKSADSIKTMVDTVKDYTAVVDSIINGNWGNGQARWDALTAAGYDWAHAQNLVNEKLGNSLRRATTYKEVQNQVAEAQTKTTEATVEYLASLADLSDAELLAIFKNEEMVRSFRELQRVAKQIGMPFKEFLANIEEIDGRWILINTFKNACSGLVSAFNAIKDAWVETIGVITADDLFNVIAWLHKLSTHLVMSEETADKLKRTFKGVFAVLDMAFRLVAGPVMLLFRLVLGFLKALEILPNDLLGMTAVIGDYLVALRDWTYNMLDLTDVFAMLSPYLDLAIREVNKFFRTIERSEAYQKFSKALKEMKAAVTSWMKGMLEAENVPKYILDGLINGIKKGVPKAVNAMINFGKSLLDGIKRILGIHSPSTEFYEIGKNIVQGLYNGIKEMIKMVYTLITSVGGKLIEIIRNLDLGSIFTIAIGGGMVYSFVKIAKALELLTSPLEHMDDLVENAAGAMKSLKGLLGSMKLRVVAESIKSIAIAIAILAGSIALLTLLDQGKMWSAVGAISVMIILLGALTAVAGHYGKDAKGLELGKIALSLLGLAVALAIMAKAMRTISKIDSEQAIQTMVGFVGIITALLLLMKSIGKNGDKLVNIGGTFLAIGAAFYLLARSAKIFSKISWTGLGKAGAAIGVLTVVMISLMAATRLMKNDIKSAANIAKIGKTLLAISGAMLIMAIAAKMIAKMEEGELIKAGISLGVLTIFIAGLIKAVGRLSGAEIAKVGSTILGIGAAMLLLTVAAKMIASMDVGELIKAGIGLMVLVLFIDSLVMTLSDMKPTDLTKVGTTLLAMSVAIGILAAAAALLGMIDFWNLAQGVVAVGGLVFAMSILVKSLEKAKSATGTMIAITVSIGLLALAVGLLSMIDPKRLGDATIAMISVMGMFALMIKATENMKNAMGTLIVMTVAIGIMTTALILLSKIPAEQALASSVALAILMGALAGTMLALSGIGNFMGNVLPGILGLLALCVPLYILIDVLSKMQDISNAAANATVLAAFMGVLAVVQLACAAAGAIYSMTGGVAMLGLVGMVALVGTLYLLMGALAIMSNIPDAISNLNALTSFVITMTKVLIALAIVGPLAAVGVSALSSLIGLMTVIGTLAVAIGYLTDKVPSIQKFLDSGVPVLVGLANGIGRILGAFASGILTGITSGLPQMGKDLSGFMNNASDFIDGASKINPSMMDGVKALGEAILILTGANILESLTSWLTGGSSLADFGGELKGLGTSLKEFASSLGTFDDSTVATVDCASRAIKSLAEAAAAIPNKGGLWASIVGENSLTAFGSELPVLGTYLNGFISNLGSFDESKVSVVDCAGKAIKALAEAAQEIPNEGGLWGAIAGDNGLAAFGSKLPQLGTDLKGFITNLGTFDESKITTVNCAGEAIKALAKAAKEIPNEGGLWAAIVGDNSLSTFAGQLPSLGSNIAKFVANLGTFSEAQVNSIKSTCDAIKAIVKLGEIDIKDTGSSMNSFGKNMVKFAKKVKEFVTEISNAGSEGISSSISKVKELLEMAKTIAKTNVGAITTFGDSLKKLAKDGVKSFVKEFDSATAKADANDAAKKLVKEAIKGAESKKSDIKDKFESVVKAGVDKLYTKSLGDKAKQAGKDLVKGFAKGIKDNKYLAENAGSEIGKAALKAAKEAIDSNSPSKEAMKIGNYFGDGFVIGIKEYSSKVYDTSYGVADRAKEGLSRAIAKVSSILNSDMDTQPTIRPVLDLSEIKDGANSLNSMFNNGPSLGVSANLNAINSGMKSRSQNGANDGVILAIDKLRKDLGNVPRGDTFNVNGITYDDGTNMSNAVRDLIRAAKVERRV